MGFSKNVPRLTAKGRRTRSRLVGSKQAAGRGTPRQGDLRQPFFRLGGGPRQGGKGESPLVSSGEGGGVAERWRPARGAGQRVGSRVKEGNTRHTGVRAVPLLHAFPRHVPQKS